MVHILVLEDDKQLNQIVCTYLRDNGFSATGCTVCLYRSTAVGDSNTSVAWIAML